MPRKPKRFGSYKPEVRAACFGEGCGRTWKGARAGAAAIRHAAETGHPVAVRTTEMVCYGASWKDVLCRVSADAAEFSPADVQPSVRQAHRNLVSD